MVADSPWEGAPAAGGDWVLPDTGAQGRSPGTQRARAGRRPRWIAMWGRSQLKAPWTPRPRVGRPSLPLDPTPQLSSKHWAACGSHSPLCPQQETRSCRCRLHVHADSERREPHTHMPHTQAGGSCHTRITLWARHSTRTQRQDLSPAPPHSLANRPLCPFWASASL